MDGPKKFDWPRTEEVKERAGSLIDAAGSLSALEIPVNHKIALAIILNDVSCIKALKENPLEKPLFAAEGIYATHIAAAYDRPEIFKLLMETYKPPLLKTLNKSVAMHWACANNHEQIIEYLLALHAKGFDIGLNQCDKEFDHTPLDELYQYQKWQMDKPEKKDVNNLMDLLRKHGAKHSRELPVSFE